MPILSQNDTIGRDRIGRGRRERCPIVAHEVERHCGTGSLDGKSGSSAGAASPRRSLRTPPLGRSYYGGWSGRTKHCGPELDADRRRRSRSSGELFPRHGGASCWTTGRCASLKRACGATADGPGQRPERARRHASSEKPPVLIHLMVFLCGPVPYRDMHTAYFPGAA